MNLYIGIDLGTSAVKLQLVNEKGEILKTVTKEYPLRFPKPGWSEQDPADWWRAVQHGILQLTEHADKSLIRGIGCGGQMHGLVALDENDAVIRPAILWNDGRTGEEVEYLNTVIGKERLSAMTANIAFAGFTAPKLLWMKKKEPENFARIKKIMLPKDYINYRLTGVHATDCSDASGTLLFDVERRRWSEKMLELCSLRREQVARVFESSEPVGTLLPGVAEELGLKEDVLVAAGAGDNAAAAVGTGTVGQGRCNISLGTSGTFFLSGERYTPSSNHALHAFCHADGGWHFLGCELSAASCVSWWSALSGAGDPAAAQADIREETLGRNSVFFLPYLMGERTPHNDAFARGAFVGMRMDSTREDMTQAVLEGVAFGLRDALEIARAAGIEVRTAGLSGGGAKSPLWRKILANILDLELALPETEQGPGLGGAMLAAVACGVFPDVQTAAKELTGGIARRTEPDKEITALYDERYQVYRSLYPALKQSFRTM